MDNAKTDRRPWLDVTSLVIETTRKCNLDCEHCLRGDAEPVDMDPELLAKFLKNVVHITGVTFSGGEPSLNLEIIRTFYRLCDEYGIPVDSFFVATNGVANQEDLALLLLEQYARIEDSEYRKYCGVSLSTDPYHDGALRRCTSMEEPSHIIEGLAFYDDQKSHGPNEEVDWIIPEGRALENGLPHTWKYETVDHFYVTREGDRVSVDTMYLSTNGYVYSDHNLSYDEMDAAPEYPDDCPAAAVRVGDNMREKIVALSKD